MSMNRRSFIGRLIQVSGFALLAPSLLRPALAAGEAASSNGTVPMLDPKDSTASAVKYVVDAKKSKTSKGNKCATCQFFTAKGNQGGKDVGACLIFAGKYVNAGGFCNSWAKKV